MKRFFQSRKNWQCIISSLIFTITLLFTYSDLDKTQKLAALVTYITAVAAVWGINTAATGLEDYGQKRSNSQQINVGTVDRPIGNVPVQNNNKIAPLLLIGCLLLLAGCGACPDKIVLRESLDQASRPMLLEDLDLVKRIATSQPLPKFNADDVRIRENYKAQFEGIINDDRQRDKGFLLGN